VIAADRDPAAPGFAFADRRAIISVEDEPQLDRLATAERIDGLVAPGIDWPVAIAARIAERLALPHPIDPATAVLATSKLRQRERFAEAGVPHPRHVVCATVEEAATAAAAFGYPSVA
jgi:phosphoribosylaminoimidazole carboxylase (NCAIR synthetase)